MTLAELSRKLQNGEFSAYELTKNYLEKEDEYGAYLFKNEDAISVAKEIDNRRLSGEKLHPLAGIPIAIKDNIVTKGMPTTCASRTLEGYIPPYDATVVEKIKKAGMPILGKTNMDEFGMGSTGENSAFYPTKNPKDTTLVPGGSSSGSAAAVSGGLAPVALGSDTGGSCRLPATYCGVVGFKPSYGAVSRYGLIAFASSLDQIGIIGKCAEDIGLVFDLISGRDPRDMTSIETKNIRIDRPRVRNICDFNDKIFKTVLYAYYIISSAEAYSNLNRYDGVYYGKCRKFGEEVQRRVELGAYVSGHENVGEYYEKASAARRAICDKMDEIFKECDFIVTPTVKGDVPQLGSLKNGADMYELDEFTTLANLAYLPAISLPSGITIMGRRGEDMSLISYAREVEKNGI
ncbi:MAG: aspartyl/glutamyl-tRNA amidotransferase subunit A [Clostridia bacterium]|nr:aspartyl/glutamyl-tRNA amidotransferase subunit A [Clostridia bacterium]